MTLLEALAALVILGLTVTGSLAAMQESSRAAGRTAETARTLAHAEAVLDEVVARGGDAARWYAQHPDARVAVRPWRDGIVQVTVAVRGEGGAVVELHRLVATR